MKNDDILKKIRQESENVTLPDSLKKDNIVSKLEERPNIQIVTKKSDKMTKSVKRRIASTVVSVAAAVAIIVGITAIPNRVVVPAKQEKPAVTGDYSEIEKLVSEYYMNNIYREESFFDRVIKTFSASKGTGAIDTGMPETVNESADNLSSSKDDYGTTNIQVQGVDEADIVKNDGRYLYRLVRNQLFVIDCADKKNMKKVYKTWLYSNDEDVYYNSAQMFINGNKLVVVVNHDRQYGNVHVGGAEIYDCCYINFRSKTVFYVYDITDKSNIKKEFEYSVDGLFKSARMFNGKILIVSDYSVPYYDVTGDKPEDVSRAIAEISIPCVTVGGEETRIIKDNISIANREAPMNYIVTVMFDTDNAEKTVQTTATLGDTSSIYCTDKYLFTAKSKYPEWTVNGSKTFEIDGNSCINSTDIYMYDVSGKKAEFVSKSTVPGVCIGQFSMDYYNDYFRIALTASFENKNDENYIYVLDKDLNIVGKTERFGIDERIRSVRFMGDIAYVVTFRQTDPLFAIDLSNPKAPKITGEVKLPGFSEYLHPVGNGLVMGIGYNGTEEGIDGNGKISLFDVSDKTNPKELSSYIVKFADINTDSRAFTTINSKKMFCILANDYYENILKALVFSINNGELKLEFEVNAGINFNYFDARSTYIGDNLYVFSDSGVYSFSLLDGSEIDSLAL